MACFEALRAAMRRRDFLPVIAGATIWPLAARAQKQTMPMVGILGPPLTAEQQVALFGAFRQGLAEAGYVVGKNVAIEERFTSPELGFEAAGELVRHKWGRFLPAARRQPSLEMALTVSVADCSRRP
jgi:hypothetical protein